MCILAEEVQDALAGPVQGSRLNPCTATNPRTPGKPANPVPGWIGFVPDSPAFNESPTPEKSAVARPGDLPAFRALILICARPEGTAGRLALVTGGADEHAGRRAGPALTVGNRAHALAVEKSRTAPLAFQFVGNAGKADAVEFFDEIDARDEPPVGLHAAQSVGVIGQPLLLATPCKVPDSLDRCVDATTTFVVP